MAVNKQNMILWVKGLRSNRFKQARNALAIRTGSHWEHCCLGVACEVAIENGLPLKVEIIKDPIEGDTKAFGQWEDQSVLPPEVAIWLGLNGNNPLLKAPVDGGRCSAVGLNDAHCCNFEQIAQCIIDTYELEEELCQ